MCKRLHLASFVLSIVLLTLPCSAGGQDSTPPVPLMDAESAWVVQPSDGVRAQLARAPGRQNGTSALRLDFDFTKGAGFVVLQRPWTIDLPQDFRFDVWLKGDAQPNNLEFKLVDPSGHNVWWVNDRSFEFPGGWTRKSYRARHFSFAWGPLGGGVPKALGSIEFAIASSTGGRGTVWFDGLTFEPLNPLQVPSGPPLVSVSSQAHGPSSFELSSSTYACRWVPMADDASPTLTLDFRSDVEFGGLIFDWAHDGAPTACEILATTNAGRAESLGIFEMHDGRQYVPLPESQARGLIIKPIGGQHVVLDRLEIGPIGWATNDTEVWSRIARDAPRGRYPRSLLNEQVYWTVVGLPGARDEALIDEDGAIEVGTLGWRLEPFILADGTLHTWADCTSEVSLEGGWMPIPTVKRVHGELSLSVTCLADGTPDRPTWLVRYRVVNTSNAPRDITLALAARPLQVLPASQNLNITGGPSKVPSMELLANQLHASAWFVAWPASSPPSRTLLTNFAGREVVEHLASMEAKHGTRLAERSTSNVIRDDWRRACSGGLLYDLSIAPGESRDIVLRLARRDDGDAAADETIDSRSFESRLADQTRRWRQMNTPATWSLPPSAAFLEPSIRSTLAYIEINADGPSIQPGSRSYERSWIRDGSLTSAALLAFGRSDEAVRFIDWYGEHLFDNGKVPCVVDRRGPDPVPEHDSHGQYIFAVMNAYRFTRDRTIMERHWDRVLKVVAYIESQRDLRRSAEFQDSGKVRQEPGKPPVPASAFFGLMPESISHEGYSAKPMHSYWDDLFTLRGLSDATAMARVLGYEAEAQRLSVLHSSMREDLSRSIDVATKAHGIEYMPGCVELGDFDSTSTTVALWPGNFEHRLIGPTFERYWAWHQDRVAKNNWDAYTPYELRHVGALVRLGERERAWEALKWYFTHQRPQGWNHWAEVVGREDRKPRFLGDMPHTWCGSDFLNSVRTMFVYEDEPRETLVLAAGVPESWLDEGGLSIGQFSTWFGDLGFALSAVDGRVRYELSGSAKPPGGFVLAGPGHDRAMRVWIDGVEAPCKPGERLIVPASTRRIEFLRD